MKKMIMIALILGLSACSTTSKKTSSKSAAAKSSASVKLTSKSNFTDLMDAAKSHDVDTLRTLLMRGTDTNVKNSEGKTAIFYSAELGCLECIQLLIRAGAKVSVRDKKGKLPVDYLKDTPQKAEILKLLKS